MREGFALVYLEDYLKDFQLEELLVPQIIPLMNTRKALSH